jgi:hypothetical protein
MSIQLRLCSADLAAIDLASLPRNQDVSWYTERYGGMFGRVAADMAGGRIQRTHGEMVLARLGVEFVNPDQITWAVHVAGSAACGEGLDSALAYRVQQFVEGQEPFATPPGLLRELGVYALARHEDCLAFADWLKTVSRSSIEHEAANLHGSEWVSSIIAIVNNLTGIFGSVSLHGGDIGCWRGAA